VLAENSIFPFIAFMFACFIVAGILHIAFLELYKRLTPPSIIAIGRMGQERLRYARIYDALGWLMITGIIGITIKSLMGL
jgi:hypothetical protein